LAKSSTGCGTALLSVISKMSAFHFNRPPGCSAIQKLERSTTPSNGGPGHRPVEREICPAYLGQPHRDLASLFSGLLDRLGVDQDEGEDRSEPLATQAWIVRL
jgi:hypothetical protein